MNVSTKQQQIAQLARQTQSALTSIHHHIDCQWLQAAYRRVSKESAPGVDGQTVQEYGQKLEDNLRDLLNRARSGHYKAPPVLRVHIPKGDGKETRPIGMPTVEDKVLQRAISMLLEPIYEELFYDFSYGFRPGRGAHGGLEEVWNEIMGKQTEWIVDVDIRKFFDRLDHRHLRAILDRRVRDGVIRRLIDKWLAAGVMEEETVIHPQSGTPQGGVISPLLGNIFLHEVLDEWFVREVKPRLKARAFMVRYADDVVMGFERKEDAERVMKVLPKRLGRYGLELSAEKTRLVRFSRPGGTDRGQEPSEESATFDFATTTRR